MVLFSNKGKEHSNIHGITKEQQSGVRALIRSLQISNVHTGAFCGDVF